MSKRSTKGSLRASAPGPARWTAGALALVVGMAGCGTRVSDDRVQTEAGIGGTPVGAQPGSGGNDPGAGTATPGASDVASPSPGAGQVAGNRGGGGQTGATGSAKQPAGPISGPRKDNPQQAAGGRATGSPVVVGTIGTFSGPVGTVTTDIAKGIQIWAQYTNARGGVNGHPVKLIVGDDGGDPARFNSLAQQMVEQDRAIAMIFTTLELAAGGNNSYLDSKRVVTFGTLGGLDSSYENLYLPTPVPSGLAYADGIMFGFAQAAVPAGKTKLAAIACSDFSACDNFNKRWASPEMQQASGFQVVYRARPSITQPDYTSECLAAEQAGADAVLVGLDTASVQRFADACARQTYRPMFGLADQAALPSLLQNPNLDGAVVGTKIVPWITKSIPGVKAMYDAYAQVAPGLTPSGASMAGWTFGTFFAAAAAHLPANPTAQDVYNGLNQIEDNDLGGVTYPLTFTAGRPSPRKVCWGVALVKDKTYVPGPGPAYQCR